MEKTDVSGVIKNFINKMGYVENEHVIGCLFYGSYLTGYNTKTSDIDLHIIFDDTDPEHLIRGNDHVDGYRIEYFEKPLSDIYKSIDNGFSNQDNSLLSIIGTAYVLFDKTGEIEKVQAYAREKFSKPLHPISMERAKEMVSILDNRMARLEKVAMSGSLYFNHLYHLTIEKIRKFYHKLNGFPEIQTSKVDRIYTDKAYRESFYKSNIPEPEFIEKYLSAVTDPGTDRMAQLEKAQALYRYATRNVDLQKESYRIKIKSRNCIDFYTGK